MIHAALPNETRYIEFSNQHVQISHITLPTAIKNAARTDRFACKSVQNVSDISPDGEVPSQWFTPDYPKQWFECVGFNVQWNYCPPSAFNSVHGSKELNLAMTFVASAARTRPTLWLWGRVREDETIASVIVCQIADSSLTVVLYRLSCSILTKGTSTVLAVFTFDSIRRTRC